MKKILWTLVFIVLVSLIFSAPSWAAKYQMRLIRQQKMISQGIRSGELTRHEARGLLVEQHKLRRHIRSFWRDGHLSRRERHHINRWLQKSGRRIWRLTHNDRYRKQFRLPDHRYYRHADRQPWQVW